MKKLLCLATLLSCLLPLPLLPLWETITAPFNAAGCVASRIAATKWGKIWAVANTASLAIAYQLPKTLITRKSPWGTGIHNDGLWMGVSFVAQVANVLAMSKFSKEEELIKSKMKNNPLIVKHNKTANKAFKYMSWYSLMGVPLATGFVRAVASTTHKSFPHFESEWAKGAGLSYFATLPITSLLFLVAQN